jgi:hypothetical protein
MPRSTSGTLAPALGSAALSRSLDDPGGTTGVVPFPFPAMTKPRFNATGAIDMTSRFRQKPFSLRTLAHKIREILDAEALVPAAAAVRLAIRDS